MATYQTKSFCTAKETINKMKEPATEWEKTEKLKGEKHKYTTEENHQATREETNK